MEAERLMRDIPMPDSVLSSFHRENQALSSSDYNSPGLQAFAKTIQQRFERTN